MKMYKPKLTIITGASSGIGYEFAKSCASLGSDLLLISRNSAKLEDIKSELERDFNIKVLLLPCDLTKTESINQINNYLESNKLVPDLLFNNAGKGLYGIFDSNLSEKENEIIHLNIIALTSLCKIIAEIMKANRYGIIINVSSTAAFHISSKWSVYAATKSYVFSFSLSLAEELIKSGILVSVLCPGKTDTDFDINSGNPDYNKKEKSSAEFVVQYTLNKVARGKQIIIPGIKNKLKYFFSKYCPIFIYKLIILKYYNN